MSGIFYVQDTCNKISYQASIDKKWLRKEFNKTSEWIHGFSYLTAFILLCPISVSYQLNDLMQEMDKVG